MAETETGHKILIVDDDPEDVEILGSLLRDLGESQPRITTVDGATAAERLLYDGNFDVCFLDGRLGQDDGIDVLKRVTAVDVTCPIIILTGQGDEAVAARALRYGATDYMAKRDLNADVLNASLRHALQVRAEKKRRQDAELALRLSEARYRDLINRMPMVLCELAPDGETLFVNNGVYQITGYRPQDLIGRNWWQVLVSEDDRESIDRVQAALRAGDVTAFEMALTGRQGQALTVEWNSANRFRQDGDLANIVLIGMDVTERVQLREELRRMAVRDELTGLNNRRGFMTLAEQQLLLAAREQRAMLLLFIDLDGLKAINDQRGHAEGDRAIRDMADVLRKTFRGSDVLARLGGDEFVVLVTETPKFSPDYVQKRLHDHIEAFNKVGSRRYLLRASMGIARYDPESGVSVDVLLNRADTLMYQDKQSRPHRRDNIVISTKA